MKIYDLIIFLLLIFAVMIFLSKSEAGESMTVKDWQGIGLFTIVHALDTLQTVSIVGDKRYYEMNEPFLGRYPSKMQIIGSSITMELLYIGSIALLPRKYRDYMQGFWIGAKMTVVLDNRVVIGHFGIRF